MKGTITNFVPACHVCQRSKYQASSPAGLLQPLPIPKAIWEEISMNFIVGLPKSKGFDAVLVVVDKDGVMCISSIFYIEFGHFMIRQ